MSKLSWKLGIDRLALTSLPRLVFDHLDLAETQALADGLAKIAGNLCDHAQFQRGER